MLFALEGVGRSMNDVVLEVRDSANVVGNDGRCQQLREPFNESQRDDLLKVSGSGALHFSLYLSINL